MMEGLERLAERARLNLAFRQRTAPQPRTEPGQIERAIARMRRVIQRRDKAQLA